MLAVYVAVTVLALNLLALAVVAAQAATAMGISVVQQVRAPRPLRPHTRPDGRADLRPVPASAPAVHAAPAMRGRW